MRASLMLLILVVRCYASEPGAKALFKLADVLPSGRCEIELMTIRFSDRANGLEAKMQSAVATNRHWFLEHVRKAKPGAPLDFDPRLGLTQMEYAEYLREAENGHLASAGTRLPCVFHRNGDVLALDIGDTNSPLSKIRLNMATGKLFASGLRIGMPTWRTSNDPTTPIGAYDGCSWKYEKGDLDAFDVRIVGLDIWRLNPSGRILLRFKDAEMVRKQSTQNFEMLFQLPAKGVQPDGSTMGSQASPSATNRASSTTGPKR